MAALPDWVWPVCGDRSEVLGLAVTCALPYGHGGSHQDAPAGGSGGITLGWQA